MLPLPARPRVPIACYPRQRHLANFYASSYHRRSQNFTAGYSSSYDPEDDRNRGPIFKKTKDYGVPKFYPRDLKRRIDDYVIGQNRAKKTICTAIFNHYQNLRRRKVHEAEDQLLREKLRRQRFAHDFVNESPRERKARRSADDTPSDQTSVRGRQAVHEDAMGQESAPEGLYRTAEARAAEELKDMASTFYIPEDPDKRKPVKINTSNLLLIGPTGVGKTYILETLSSKLNVPFTICDCNSFTQAGYIGQDVESCIERLLVEANYDATATEHGIVVLDEFDKIARRETNNGRDVGGEGVQQALLKLVEGTKITVNVKDNKSTRPPVPTSSLGCAGSGLQAPPSHGQSGNKIDQYTIDTTNILFVFCGAFVGLEKTILRRVNKASMGFGYEIRLSRVDADGRDLLPPDMYSHLPHQPHRPEGAETSDAGRSTTGDFTPLDLTTPGDLQAFGFIPELIGRIPNVCALTPLSLDELFRILIEPRNSLVAQYTALFETYPSQLFFTRRALHAIAERARSNGTGARGLRMEMERVLAEPMYDAPTAYVLITEACVQGKDKAGYWGKDGYLDLMRMLDEEDGLQRRHETQTMVNEPLLQDDAMFEPLREAGQNGA